MAGVVQSREQVGGVPVPFAESPNMLFATRVRAVSRPSPAFVRVTLAGRGLGRFAPYRLDQRIKIVLPGDDEVADAFQADMREQEWRRVWRALPADRRPVLRSYTAYAVRPDAGEIDLDFYLHSPPGPASAWASTARVGDPLLVSGPDVRAGDRWHGVQWRPGRARRVLLAADETAFPAVHGILGALGAGVEAQVLLEAGDVADVAVLDGLLDGHSVEVVPRSGRGGEVLASAVTAWTARSASAAAALGDGFYAWMATESVHVARMRRTVLGAGVGAGRVHVQGYWHDRERPPVQD